MSSDSAKGAQEEASSAKGPAPQPSLITPREDDDSSPVYAVELPIFEGPLDLLLHLVRRHELDILDIPIAFVTEKYLEYLEVMRALDIEVAGDYLVMAATLAYLKSRELVPQQDAEEEESDGDDDDGEDPREALIRRLIEYERFRAAGRELNEMPVAGRDVFTRGGSIDLPPLDPGMAPVTLFRLAEAYARVLQRAKISKSHEVVIERVTVRQRMEQLSLILEERGDVEFDSLFLEREWSSVLELRQMLVVTLMSVLELVKLGIIGVQQPIDTATIRLLRRASHADTMQALTGYDEDASFGEAVAPKPAGAPPAGGAPQLPPPAAPAGPASGGPAADTGISAVEGAELGDGVDEGDAEPGADAAPLESGEGEVLAAARDAEDTDADLRSGEGAAEAVALGDAEEDEDGWDAAAESPTGDVELGGAPPEVEAYAVPGEDAVAVAGEVLAERDVHFEPEGWDVVDNEALRADLDEEDEVGDGAQRGAAAENASAGRGQPVEPEDDDDAVDLGAAEVEGGRAPPADDVFAALDEDEVVEDGSGWSVAAADDDAQGDAPRDPYGDGDGDGDGDAWSDVVEDTLTEPDGFDASETRTVEAPLDRDLEEDPRPSARAPEGSPANEAGGAAPVGGEASEADDTTSDTPSAVDGDDPRESDE